MNETLIIDGEEFHFKSVGWPPGSFHVWYADTHLVLTATDQVWMLDDDVDADDCLWTDRDAAIARIHKLNEA